MTEGGSGALWEIGLGLGRQSVVLTNKIMAWGTVGDDWRTAGDGVGQGSPVTKTRQQ